MAESKKHAIMLRQPDKITLTYGDRDIELLWPDFAQNFFTVDEDQLEELHPYMVEGIQGEEKPCE